MRTLCAQLRVGAAWRTWIGQMRLLLGQSPPPPGFKEHFFARVQAYTVGYDHRFRFDAAPGYGSRRPSNVVRRSRQIKDYLRFSSCGRGGASTGSTIRKGAVTNKQEAPRALCKECSGARDKLIMGGVR